MTAICRTCRRPIKQVSDGRWGHIERAYFQPHYAKPQIQHVTLRGISVDKGMVGGDGGITIIESEAEKREAWGK